MATVFESALGISQGRIDPSNEEPAEGTYSFVLGDERTVIAELDDGDGVTLSQEFDTTGIGLVRFGSLVLHEPEDAEGEGLRWEVSVIALGAVIKTVRGRPGRAHTFSDLALDLHGVSGLQTIAVRLELAPA